MEKFLTAKTMKMFLELSSPKQQYRIWKNNYFSCNISAADI